MISNQLMETWGEPLQLEHEMLDGKLTLIARKPVIILSEIIEEIEPCLFASPGIREVHFVASDCFFIDCNLLSTKWHGKNIIVVSNVVECVKFNLTWNLSGRNGVDGSSDPEGNNATHGCHGENGGHLLLLGNRFVNINLLTFKSNGGNGCGGCTVHSLPNSLKVELRQAFLSQARIPVHGFWENVSHCVNFFKKLEELGVLLGSERLAPDFFSEHNSKAIFCGGNVFVEKGDELDGVHVEFSSSMVYAGESFHKHTYCIIKVSSPNADGLKKVAAKGGLGGFPGKFLVSRMTGSTLNFQQLGLECELNRGRNGPDGYYVSDLAYIDRSGWEQPKVYDSGRYELKTVPKDSPDSVYSAFSNSWKCIAEVKEETGKENEIENCKVIIASPSPLVEKDVEKIRQLYEEVVVVTHSNTHDMLNKDDSEWWINNNLTKFRN